VATFGHLTLIETMVHELPRGRQREGTDSPIVFSSSPTPLGDETDRFIREEMLEPSLARGRAVLYSGSDRSPVPSLVREVLADASRLPGHSRAIAQHLFETQTGGASAGVFMAAQASQAGQARVVLMKAEHQEGVRLRHRDQGGEVVFSAEHLTELLMGQNSRVYKIAMFWLDANEELTGLMVDHQNGSAFADYFLYEFLGCELTDPDEVQTEDFVGAVAKFINSNQLSPDKRTRYATAAVAYLDSPQDRIRPAQFLTDFIDPTDRDVVAEMMPARIRSSDFRKDVRLVSSQIGALRLSSADGSVSLSATAEALSDGTVVVEDDRVVVNKSLGNLALTKRPRG
jgi:hypothetical protein